MRIINKKKIFHVYCALNTYNENIENHVDALNIASIRHGHHVRKTSFRYQHTGWDSLRVFFRDTSWNGTFNLPIENCASEASTWLKVDIDAFISRKYQVILLTSP